MRIINKIGIKCIAGIFFLLISSVAISQNITVSGKVIGSNDEPIIGATVVVKNTSKGTITNLDGLYTIQGVSEKDVLEFSYVGYSNVEKTIGKQKIINVTLTESSVALEQVVVVGYGTQKKVNLTGAVSAVTVDDKIAGRSISNTSTALQGLVPGLTVTQNSGMAGNNTSTILIRGLGTINDASPLIVVDDMPDVDINRLNMDDIESISVLKDAAASSIYGSRGANGVILIKTKSGKSAKKTKITFSGSHAWENPVNSYSFLSDYAMALEVHRTAQAATNIDESTQIYKKATIDEWLAMGMVDSRKYPNTDWWDLIMRTGSMQNYNISATGGNDVSNFYASIGYLDQQGLQINNDYDRYNVRFNFDYKIFKNLTTGMRMDGNWSNFLYTLDGGFTGGGNTSIQSAIAGITPYDPVLGVYGSVMAVGEDIGSANPLAMFTTNLSHRDDQQLNGTFFLDWEPIKNLHARVDYSLRYANSFFWRAGTPTQAYNFQTESFTDKWYVSENAGVENTAWTSYKTLLNTRLNYSKKFNQNHNLDALFVYSEEYWYGRSLHAAREKRIHESLTELNAASSENSTNSGSSYTEGLCSYVGRLNYNAYDRYLFELNFRVDGSSRFQEGSQYGFFPSASGAWRFSEESFVKPLVEKWMDNGKFRVSYGGLGNLSAVGRTEQQELLFSNSYMIDGSVSKGFVYSKMLNPDLSWEKTNVLNVGLDFVFLNNRLSTEFDYYDRLTTGMIQQSQMSNHLTGAYEAPRQNIGVLRNRGLEGNFTWRDKIKDFNYSVNFNVSYNASRLENWAEFLDKGYTYVNMPYHFVYGYRDTGITQSYADIYNTTLQWAQPGDILRVDVNGDGIVNSNDAIAYVNKSRDMPTTNFGLNIKMDWKGFDLSALFQGTAGRATYWSTRFNSVNIPARSFASTAEHLTNPWSYDNRDGLWSRLAYSTSNQANSDFWLDDMSYIRMKNLMIGYSLPKKISKKAYIDNLRIYYSTENLFTISNYRGLDPEKSSISDMYPIVKSNSIGISVSF